MDFRFFLNAQSCHINAVLFYVPESEGSIAADDPQLGIDWHIPSEQYIRSNKDLKAASFEAYCQNPAFHFTKGCMR